MKKRISEKISKLTDEEIPANFHSLRSHSEQLKQVASYCEYSYSNPEFDKDSSFNLTKEKTQQALASIADNIYLISNNLVELLDCQSLLVEHMNFKLKQLAAEANMRTELNNRSQISKVCVLKDKKVIGRVLYKSHEEKPKENKFKPFKPIDYSSLDNIGHGFIISSTRRNSCSMTTPDLNINPPTPPLISKVTSNVTRSLYLKPKYLTPYKRISPPNVPNWYDSNLNRQNSSTNILTSNNSASQLSQLSCDNNNSLETSINNDEYWISTNLENIEYESTKAFKIYDSQNDLQPRKESLDETLAGSFRSVVYEDPNFDSGSNVIENSDDKID